MKGEQPGLFGAEGDDLVAEKRPNLMCPDGTPLNEAVSILIKELRRSKELEALYWARQIEENFHKYLWRRLAIFAAEDVGIATPQAIVVVRSLWESYDQIRADSAKKKPDGNILAMAILFLARAEKSREGDYLWGLTDELMRRDWKPDIPEYAIDMHTRRGKAKYTDPKERKRLWFTKWSKVTNRHGPQDYLAWHLKRMLADGVMTQEQYDEAMEEIGDERFFDPGELPEW